MEQEEHIYAAIDLKSFYASVECVERGLDPLTANLVVADESRTEKTICLAVSPSLKAYGISGRARLFEVLQRVREVNEERRRAAKGHRLSGESFDSAELKKSPWLAAGFVIAKPRISLYMEYSAKIYNIYLKYIAPEDIHVYSVDEVFIDLTHYLKIYRLTPRKTVVKMIRDVLDSTGITATAGIGTNLYLCKVAMDIEAKHTKPDKDGVRVAWLDEMSYRRLLWGHTPITDFWRVGRGYASKLAEHGIFTMGDVARCSVGAADSYYNEDLLYKLFGVNAELLIDHAWGWEPCTIAQIKEYKPENSSISSGQVLQCPYDYRKTRLIVREMADNLALDLVDKALVTDQLVLTVGYDTGNLANAAVRSEYKGEVTTDRYGRRIPKHAHGSINLERRTSSTRLIIEAALKLYDRIIDKRLTARRIYIVANHVADERSEPQGPKYEQLELFKDYDEIQRKRQEEESELKREKDMQHAVLDIKKKFGKNALVKGMNLQEGATAISRNGQIGGHKA
ncbi:MAG: DNA methylase [Butyrivibrio sp.]|nr:DNA methylase [Butyrivibrio sp.]